MPTGSETLSDDASEAEQSQVTQVSRVTAPADAAARPGAPTPPVSRTAATSPGTPARMPPPGAGAPVRATPAGPAAGTGPSAAAAPAARTSPPISAPAAAHPAAAPNAAPTPHAAPAHPAPAPAAPAAEFHCEEDEAKRLLVKFAGSSLPASKPPAAAGAALLQQLARLAEKAGLAVSRNANGTILFSTGTAETVVLFEDGLFGTIKRDRKSFPAIPIQWNAFERKFEGTQPERAPRDGEPEFRIPRRSALAVLTEVILQRLSAGEVK